MHFYYLRIVKIALLIVSPVVTFVTVSADDEDDTVFTVRGDAPATVDILEEDYSDLHDYKYGIERGDGRRADDDEDDDGDGDSPPSGSESQTQETTTDDGTTRKGKTTEHRVTRQYGESVPKHWVPNEDELSQAWLRKVEHGYPGVYRLPSGVLIQVLKRGTDDDGSFSPREDSPTLIHYVASLRTGMKFDSTTDNIQRGIKVNYDDQTDDQENNKDADSVTSNEKKNSEDKSSRDMLATAVEVIPKYCMPAWQEVLPLMREGDKWNVFVPSALGYGPKGLTKVVPPHAALEFEVQLMKVLDESTDVQYERKLEEARAAMEKELGKDLLKTLGEEKYNQMLQYHAEKKAAAERLLKTTRAKKTAAEASSELRRLIGIGHEDLVTADEALAAWKRAHTEAGSTSNDDDLKKKELYQEYDQMIARGAGVNLGQTRAPYVSPYNSSDPEVLAEGRRRAVASEQVQEKLHKAMADVIEQAGSTTKTKDSPAQAVQQKQKAALDGNPVTVDEEQRKKDRILAHLRRAHEMENNDGGGNEGGNVDYDEYKNVISKYFSEADAQAEIDRMVQRAKLKRSLGARIQKENRVTRQPMKENANEEAEAEGEASLSADESPSKETYFTALKKDAENRYTSRNRRPLYLLHTPASSSSVSATALFLTAAAAGVVAVTGALPRRRRDSSSRSRMRLYKTGE